MIPAQVRDRMPGPGRMRPWPTTQRRNQTEDQDHEPADTRQGRSAQHRGAGREDRLPAVPRRKSESHFLTSPQISAGMGTHSPLSLRMCTHALTADGPSNRLLEPSARFGGPRDRRGRRGDVRASGRPCRSVRGPAPRRMACRSPAFLQSVRRLPAGRSRCYLLGPSPGPRRQPRPGPAMHFPRSGEPVPGPPFGSLAEVGKLADRRASRPVRCFRFFARTPEIAPIPCRSAPETGHGVELRAVCPGNHP